MQLLQDLCVSWLVQASPAISLVSSIWPEGEREAITNKHNLCNTTKWVKLQSARHCEARLIELQHCRYECGESDGAWTHTLLLRGTTLMQFT